MQQIDCDSHSHTHTRVVSHRYSVVLANEGEETFRMTAIDAEHEEPSYKNPEIVALNCLKTAPYNNAS